MLMMGYCLIGLVGNVVTLFAGCYFDYVVLVSLVWLDFCLWVLIDCWLISCVCMLVWFVLI